MNGLFDLILNSQSGGGVEQLARTFGLSNSDAARAVAGLLPGLSRGVLNEASNSQGLEGLARALGQGNHQRYLDEPGQLAGSETVADGNNILGHLFGGKDASRALAGQAAASTGLDENVLKKMLPVVAAMMMGGLSKQSSATIAGGNIGNTPSTTDTGSLGAMLTSMLDADKDGSIADDLFGIARRFFQ